MLGEILTQPSPQNESPFLQARRLIRVSQTVAGDLAGVSRQAIGALEKGERTPKVPELLKLASLYRLRPETLLAGGELLTGAAPRGLALFRAADGAQLTAHDKREIFLAEQALESWSTPTTMPVLPPGLLVPEVCDHIRRLVDEVRIPFDPFRALYNMGVLLWFTSLNKVDGAIIRTGASDRWAMVVNSDQPDDRIRFSAAHELAHAVLGHRGWEHLHIDAFGAPRDQQDKDADQFAGELLMPATSLLREIESYRNGDNLSELLYRIADRFQVSYAAVVVRFGNLGVFTPATVEQLRTIRPTDLEARLALKTKRVEKFQGDAVLPALCDKLVREQRLSAGWNADFANGWYHVRTIQNAAVRQYIQTVRPIDRADSINQVHQAVAAWIARQFPCAW